MGWIFGNKCLNFGISSDRIQHLLWRLLDLKDKNIQINSNYIILLIGTNNTGVERDTNKIRNTNEEIIEDYKNLIKTLKDIFPDSKILFYCLFPRQDKTPEQYKQIFEINNKLLELNYLM
jgi:lysophospholipase L1-like esterase